MMQRCVISLVFRLAIRACRFLGVEGQSRCRGWSRPFLSHKRLAAFSLPVHRGGGPCWRQAIPECLHALEV